MSHIYYLYKRKFWKKDKDSILRGDVKNRLLGLRWKESMYRFQLRKIFRLLWEVYKLLSRVQGRFRRKVGS